MSDRIEVRGLRVLGRHGALPGERDRAQPFSIDLDLELDLSRAGGSDDLLDTVDYGDVTRRVVDVVEQSSFALLESLATAVATAVLSDGLIDVVVVTLHKVRPPLAADVGSVGVVIRRVQGGSEPPDEHR